MPSRCSSVDLPAPDGPMMEMNSPSFTSALMRRNTNVLVGPCSKYFSTFRRTIRGELIGYLYYEELRSEKQKSEFRSQNSESRTISPDSDRSPTPTILNSGFRILQWNIDARFDQTCPVIGQRST